MAADRFTGQSLADCASCPAGGRRFRTAKSCVDCGRPLCLSCRPWVPGAPHRCPDCSGIPADSALAEPGAAVRRLTAAGLTPPYWLTLLQERLARTPDRGELETD